MARNSFLDMMDEDERRAPQPPPGVFLKVQHNLRMAQTGSRLADHFLPRLFQTGLFMFGGNSNKPSRPKPPHLPHTDDSDSRV